MGLTPLEGLTPRPGLQGQWAWDGVGSSLPASALSAQASDLSSWPPGREWMEQAWVSSLGSDRGGRTLWWQQEESWGRGPWPVWPG